MPAVRSLPLPTIPAYLLLLTCLSVCHWRCYISRCIKFLFSLAARKHKKEELLQALPNVKKNEVGDRFPLDAKCNHLLPISCCLTGVKKFPNFSAHFSYPFPPCNLFVN